MNLHLHLKITGYIFIGLACLHVWFPKYFNWNKELASLSLINRQLMYVHTFFIALIVFLMGLLCITQTQEIITTSLGRKLSMGLFIFWFVRLIFQWFVYSPQLWKGKRFETTVHIVFTILWAYFSILFYVVAWLQ